MDFSNFSQNLELVLTRGLPIMLAGMVGIFLVTAIIIAVISLLSFLFRRDENLIRGWKALWSKKN